MGRRVDRYPVQGRNSMQHWPKLRGFWRVIFNFAVIQVGRFIPWLGVKGWLYSRLLGVQVGRDASIGLMVMLDIFFPEYITIGEDSIIGYNTTILCHEFLPREYRVGQVHIGKGVLVGANCTVLPGVAIGDGSIVAAGSVVNTDIPPGVVAGGVPARVIKGLEEDSHV